jgi:hypothetical protein
VAFRLGDDHLEAYRLVELLDLVAFLSLEDDFLVAFLGRVDHLNQVAYLSLEDADLVAFLNLGDLKVSK